MYELFFWLVTPIEGFLAVFCVFCTTQVTSHASHKNLKKILIRYINSLCIILVNMNINVQQPQQN